MGLEVDDIAGSKYGVLGGGVESSEHFFFHAEFVGNASVGVAVVGHHVVDAVALSDGVLLHIFRHYLFEHGIKFVGGFGLYVVTMKPVSLYQVDEFVGVARIGGIAAPFESVSPAAIVGGGEVEQWRIAFFHQKPGMVFVALFGGVVCAETFADLIVVVCDGGIGPFRAAFDAEMVVAFRGERTFALLAFEQPLGECDACRDAVLPAVLHGNAVKSGNIVVVIICMAREDDERQKYVCD